VTKQKFTIHKADTYTYLAFVRSEKVYF